MDCAEVYEGVPESLNDMKKILLHGKYEAGKIEGITIMPGHHGWLKERGKWVHRLVTWTEKDGMKVYVNGVLRKTVSKATKEDSRRYVDKKMRKETPKSGQTSGN